MFCVVCFVCCACCVVLCCVWFVLYCVGCVWCVVCWALEKVRRCSLQYSFFVYDIVVWLFFFRRRGLTAHVASLGKGSVTYSNHVAIILVQLSSEPIKLLPIRLSSQPHKEPPFPFFDNLYCHSHNGTYHTWFFWSYKYHHKIR